MTDNLREELQLLIDTRFSVDTDELQAMLDNHPALTVAPTHRSHDMTDDSEELRAALLMITHKANEANIHRDEDDVLETIIEIARAALAAAPQPAPEREVDEAFLSLCEAVGVPATKFAAQEYRARVTSPADRDAIIEVLRRYMIHHRIPEAADALLARGLRLPGAEETMAWAVIGEDGAIDPRKLWINSRDAEEYCERGERAVRVAIRVVEGGDDASADNS